MATGDRILGAAGREQEIWIFFFGGSARDLDGSRRAGYVLANKLKEIRMDQNKTTTLMQPQRPLQARPAAYLTHHTQQLRSENYCLPVDQ
jgi:hypothetical protein